MTGVSDVGVTADVVIHLAAKVGDLNESKKAWLVRAKISKTRRARHVELPDDLYRIVVDRLPAREDRDLEGPLFPIGSADRLRMAIARGCRDAGAPVFSPHDLRHRRISLLHHDGLTPTEIGKKVGQSNLSVTLAYSHVLMDDYREVDRAKLLKTCTDGEGSVAAGEGANSRLAGTFCPRCAHSGPHG